ncbi:DNA cytosine methyltransferase [Luteimonas sp. TWI662]|uniref:DNA cytosine methyltransferase n=1 Tax=Luteimonas sp. TWI662 TaxID=3136789 RepID=UPI003207E44A
MADGSRQIEFNIPRTMAVSALRNGEIVVDLFAGGGGASTALEQALGRPVDIAINHNPWAVSLHAANHPMTRHMCEDVWEADPRRETAGRPVGWLHASPDCTHFSQAKGGQPRNGKVRALSWVVPKWAGTVRPRIISLENVHQIQKWGPLVAKRCSETGRVVTLDLVPEVDPVTGGTRMVNRVADRGERVPVQNQYLIPDKRREGRTWRRFCRVMRGLGYVGEAKRLRACDYGAGTSRERQDEVELYAALRLAAADYRDADGNRGNGYWGGAAVVTGLLHGLGINEKRGYYLLMKWTSKGWIDYGKWAWGGWFTDEAPQELSR